MTPFLFRCLLLVTIFTCAVGHAAAVPQPAPPQPASEVQEVSEYFKKKGWALNKDIRISDYKRLVYLVVQDRAKPFDSVILTPDDYAMIGRSKTVQALDLRQVKVSDEGLKTVAAIPQLQSIIVKGEEVTDAGLKAIAGCSSLDDVAIISAPKVTDAGIRELAALPKLRSLTLMFMSLKGTGFETFAGHKSLAALDLMFVEGFTDEGAKHVAKITGLTKLNLGTGSKLTTAGVKTIVENHLPARFEFDKKLLDDDLLTTLVAKGWLYGPTPQGALEKKPATAAEVKHLNLERSQVTDRGMRAVLGFTNITSLFLAETQITDETFKQLSAFKKLTYVSMGKTKVTAAGLQGLADLPIRHLSLEGCDLSEHVFRVIGKIKSLEELWLGESKMSPAWIEHLGALPKLKDLNLRGAAFDDAAAKWVAKMPTIQSLSLNSTNLGDAGLRDLLTLPALRTLYLDGTKVTKPVYLQAKKDHPKVYIQYATHDR
jgi:hypothetical protein